MEHCQIGNRHLLQCDLGGKNAYFNQQISEFFMRHKPFKGHTHTQQQQQQLTFCGPLEMCLYCVRVQQKWLQCYVQPFKPIRPTNKEVKVHHQTERTDHLLLYQMIKRNITKAFTQPTIYSTECSSSSSSRCGNSNKNVSMEFDKKFMKVSNYTSI